MSAGPDERLQQVLAATDSTPTRLGVEDPQLEVLERIRAVFAADTAAILLREGNSDYLVARAACGLEEEVREGVRVPIGFGFAGTIAARKAPVILDRVDAATVINPILWEKGIRAMLGVPLLHNEDVIGVLHVGRLDEVHFTAEDGQLLRVAAERVANAILARRLAVEAAATDRLERSLVPATLPSLPGIEFGSRYAPAEGRAIGGDWYDAFTLPSGDLWLVTGDVAGHGLGAAVIMGRIKSALRAYALLGEGAASVMELSDRKVKHFEFGSMVTVVCAVARPPYETFDVCTAGHPPPVRAVPGREAELVELVVGPPLGVGQGLRRTATPVDLPPGGVLLLYTDGLVERRDESIDDGLERLRISTPAGHPNEVCRTVMHRLVRDRVPTDDIAVLAVRRV